MDKYLQRRWESAQEFKVKDIHVVGHHKYMVRSSYGGHYAVLCTIRAGKLHYARCQCPDFGETHLHGIPVCKHVLAAALWWYVDAPMLVSDSEYTQGTTLGTMLRDVRRPSNG